MVAVAVAVAVVVVVVVVPTCIQCFCVHLRHGLGLCIGASQKKRCLSAKSSLSATQRCLQQGKLGIRQSAVSLKSEGCLIACVTRARVTRTCIEGVVEDAVVVFGL